MCDPRDNGVHDDGDEDVTQETRGSRETISSSTLRRRPLAARLIELSGPHPGRIHYLGREAVVGREAGASVLVDNPDISRRHARLWSSAEGWSIEDLDSRNGTLINGVPTRRGDLRTGDEIQLGSQVLFVFSAQDELERQLQRTRRMEAIGSLAGGVAHDFNNVLTVITGNVDYLRTTIDRGDFDPQGSLQILAEMDRVCDRASQLVKQLHRFGSPSQRGSGGAVDVHDAISECVALCQRTMGGRIDIVLESRPGLLVRGDPVQLQQALVDLCVNARDAMPQGGRLTVGAARVAHERRFDLAPPGEYIEVHVSDTGCGMDHETQERAFEPFFTTRSRDGGTGLGLARVYAAVREHGGTISIESAPGEGATFLLRLPAIVRATREVLETAALPATFGAFELPEALECVLLVDDDVQVRRAMQRLLEHLGCDVTSADDGIEALEMLETGSFDLVVLDVQMPRMDGRVMLAKLRERGDETPVLVTSGGLDDAEVAALPDLGAQGFLPKPARLHDLQQALLHAMAAAETRSSVD